ncbi:alpha-E domain-containing protein [Conexibacter sp. W3-3-2]|uniref:alpha-E domain-containing protein n=1 Tax=Conexibacter sp. W3-3-2 TaxID=2675227 RepID=UPI002815558D|nr:alpha-E domain-containing protein [Conexibacter sp. W3-3-2]
MPSRVAENLFWLGRYAERAESVTRLLRVIDDRRTEFEGSDNPAGVEALRTLLQAVTRVTATEPGFLGAGATQRLASPGTELRDLVIDERRPGTVGHAVRGMLGAAYAVRDQLSTDTFLVVGTLDRTIGGISGAARAATVQAALGKVMQSVLAFSGLAQESMVRDLGWRFMDAGRRLERALQLLALLRATVTTDRGTAADSLVLESVLAAGESLITYRRRYRSQAQLATLLDLLLLDDGNPRSLAHQLARAAEDLAELPAGSGRLREDQRRVLEASTALQLADVGGLALSGADGDRPALSAFLDEQLRLLEEAALALERDHFVHRLPQRTLS